MKVKIFHGPALEVETDMNNWFDTMIDSITIVSPPSHLEAICGKVTVFIYYK